jgi:hypothetical protein
VEKIFCDSIKYFWLKNEFVDRKKQINFFVIVKNNFHLE